MNVRFSQPKYIIPLILIPFNVFLFYMLKDSFGNSNKVESQPEEIMEINTNIPLPNLEKRPLKSKFDSFRETYKYNRDFTAMKEIDRREQTTPAVTTRQKALADSVNNATIEGKQHRDFMANVQAQAQTHRVPKATASVRAIQQQQESEYDIQMRIFKDQMKYLDSLDMNREVSEGPINPAFSIPSDHDKPEIVQVQKAQVIPSTSFNTIQAKKENRFIQAIIDEEIKVYPGSRVRIRLLETIQAGDHKLEKGAYLYATVTSFKPQRIELAISSVLADGNIIPVDLNIYDNDGLPGLYVPASQFREFTKEVASNSMAGQGFQFAQTPGNETEMLYNMAERAYATATRSMSRAAKKNKARLKYNSVLYLVNKNDINQ